MTDVATETRAVSNPNHKWYIVHAYSNFEKKVAEHLRDQARAQGLEDKFSEILVPTEDVVEIRRGRKVSSERKFFPGYVLVKMEMTDDAYHLVKNTPKVTGFLGSGNKPIPVSEKEVERIVGAIEEGVERPKPTIHFAPFWKNRRGVGPQRRDPGELRTGRRARTGDCLQAWRGAKRRRRRQPRAALSGIDRRPCHPCSPEAPLSR